jgi:hypothetical protein
VWVAEVSLPNPQRRTVQRETRPEARKALKLLLATVQAPPELPPNCSLGMYLPVWLDRSVRALDPKTYLGYNGICVN